MTQSHEEGNAQGLSTDRTTWFSEASANQWNLGMGAAGVKVSALWEEYSGAGVRVAVIDDGFDVDHEEVQASYNWDLQRDFLDKDSDARAGAGNNHGTSVLGLIGAAHDGAGMQGVATGADLVGVRIGFNADWSTPVNVAAVQYSASIADVVNMSWGAGGLFSDNYANSLWGPMAASIEQGLDRAAVGWARFL